MQAQLGVAENDQVTDSGPVAARHPDFTALIEADADKEIFKALRMLKPWGRNRGAETVGRPPGNREFVNRIERLTGRSLKPAKPGPKPKSEKGALSP